LSQSSKLIFISYQEELCLVSKRGEKMMPAGKFLAKLGRWIDARVNLAANHLLCNAECRHHFGKRHFAHDDHINVAAGLFLAAGDGTMNESQSDVLRQWQKGGLKHLDHPRRFHHHAFQFRENGTVRIRLVVNLATFDRAAKNADGAEPFDFPLRGPQADARYANQSPKMERFVHVREQPRQDRAASPAEQGCREIVAPQSDILIECTHIAHNCTLFGYSRQRGFSYPVTAYPKVGHWDIMVEAVASSG
jgi:hypothetical protein